MGQLRPRSGVLYVQNGRVIPSTSETTNTGVMGIPGGYKGAITQDYCTARNTSDFNRLGGLSGMGASLARHRGHQADSEWQNSPELYAAATRGAAPWRAGRPLCYAHRDSPAGCRSRRAAGPPGASP